MRNPFRPIRHFGAAMLLAAALWSSGANAQEPFVAGTFSGTVSTVIDPFDYFGGAFEVGDIFTGSYGYRPSMLGSAPPGSSLWSYNAGPGGSFFNLSVNGIAFGHSGPSSLLIKNDTPGEPGGGGPFGDAYGFAAGLLPFAPAPPNTQLNGQNFSFQFNDPTAAALGSIVPPGVLPDLSLFGPGPHFADINYVFYGPNPNDPTVFDQFLGISSIGFEFERHGPAVAAAPEPGTAALLCGALIAAGALRRRRRQSRSIAARFV